MTASSTLHLVGSPITERPGLSPLNVGMLCTFPPTRCGLARFSSGLAAGLSANGVNVGVVRVSDGMPSQGSHVIGELVNGSATSVAECIDLLNLSDIALVQHRFGVYGGADGDEILEIIGGLDVPAIVVVHTVPRDPSPRQRAVLEQIVALAERVVVLSDTANGRLSRDFRVDGLKINTIPHGATIPTGGSVKRGNRPTLLTWGQLGPGKGIERAIDAMSALHQLNGRPRYLVAGGTHPKVLAAEGEQYRDACVQQVHDSGLAGAVFFESGYRDRESLSALVRSAAVVVLPYDSTEQDTSGVLVEAIGHGRPVVATAFPHAVELLGSGAGIVVAHDDPDALRWALRSVLTQPRLAGDMAAEARRLAPSMAWSMVAASYQAAAQQVLSIRPERI